MSQRYRPYRLRRHPVTRSQKYGDFYPRQNRDYGTHPSAAFIDPYAPDSVDFANRHREQVTERPGGTVRVDYGAAT